ncbi:hypothetical protein [Acidocella sp.]|uniref:hypothetical protein n=1 Tax=Acidocella sp. TaxID=50710 RepID=UPI002F420511
MTYATMRRYLSAFNDQLAIRSNQVFATMGFFWFCLVFTLIPLRWPAAMPFVQYASSGVLQLVAMPLIGVGTILAARSTDQQVRNQHEAMMQTVQNIQAMMTELHQTNQELSARITRALETQDDQT